MAPSGVRGVDPAAPSPAGSVLFYLPAPS